MSKNTLSALVLVGMLMLTGAGCAGSSSVKENGSSSKPASRPPVAQEQENDYDDTAELDVEAETPDLDADSTVEDYEEVSQDIEDLSQDIEEMNAEINSLNNVNTNLE